MDRSFTVIKVESASGIKGKANLGGRFISKTPSSAARKAASRICRETNVRGVCTLKVHIQETTRGSAGKVFMYKVSRVKAPTVVERGGETIQYKYKTVSRAIK